MDNCLVKQTLYACEPTSDKVTKLTLLLGYPELVREAEARVALCIRMDEGGGAEVYAFGADKWQAHMMGISMLKLRLKYMYRNNCPSFHYSREDAEQQADGVSLDDLFPIDLV